jgi:hypothetical protein
MSSDISPASPEHVVVVLDQRYQQLLEEIQRLRIDNARLTASGEFASKLVEVEKERAALWQQVTELRTTNALLESKNEALASKVDSLRATNETLTADIVELRSRCDALEEQRKQDRATIATLQQQQQEDRATIVKAQLAMCFQSKAARYVDPAWRTPKKEGKACFVKVALLASSKTQNPACVAMLTQQLVKEGLLEQNDDIPTMQVLFDSLAGPRHVLVHPTHVEVPDDELERVVAEAGSEELTGLYNVCVWLTTKVGDKGVLDVPRTQ